MQSHPRTVASESKESSDAVRNRVKIGGMVLALAAVVTVGAFVTARHNDLGAQSHAATRVAVSAAQAGEGGAKRPAISAVVHATSQAPTGPTLYLTDSVSEATNAQAELESAARLDRVGGAPASTVLVTALGDATAAYQAIADENILRATLHLPEIAVVDLRTAGSGADPSTVARQAIADENQLRASLGLPELEQTAGE
jgi:hypothetical protein